jgi:hypothetical protein
MQESINNVINSSGTSFLTENEFISLEDIPAKTPVYISDNVDPSTVNLLQKISESNSNAKVTISAI